MRTLTWTEMVRVVNTVVNELRAHGVRLFPGGTSFVKSPSHVRRSYTVRSGRDSIAAALFGRGFSKDRDGLLGKRVGNWAVAVDINGDAVEVSVTDFGIEGEEEI